jgi:hypothetical protein
MDTVLAEAAYRHAGTEIAKSRDSPYLIDSTIRESTSRGQRSNQTVEAAQ